MSIMARIFAGTSFALVLIACSLWLALKAEQRHTAKVSARLTETTAAYERFQADVKARTAEAKANDLANAARVERAQIAQQEKASSDYENLLARYRGALDRLRAAEAAPHSSGGTGAHLSRSANAASGPNSAGGSAIVSFEDLNICAVNTAKAETWLKWWESVSKIAR